jgi:peptidoglycan/LPS O-acetylase OafA/YrhL
VIRYRPEIDGLRAVAVLSVIFYQMGVSTHGINFFSGGFLGVDIFFVISGYLITSILIRDLSHNEFSFIRFYERRARRILPALALVTLVSIPLGWLFMDVSQYKELAQSIVSVTFFLSNFFFVEEISYSYSMVELKPLLHTWSLSVVEQYYILFPIVMLLCWKFARKYIMAIFTIGLIVSLLLTNWTSQKYPDTSFYLLHTRGWELLAGGVLAKLENKYDRNNNHVLDLLMPVLGTFLIVYSIAFFDDNTPHPSFQAILPVVGTILIIWFAGNKDFITKFLSSKPVVGIGLISYSLYLWHQPILAYTRLANVGELPEGSKYWVIFSIFYVSYASWRFVEKPFRDSQRVSRRKMIVLLLLTWTGILILGVFIHLNGGMPERLKIPDSVLASFKYGDGTDDPHKCADVAGAHKNIDLWCELGEPKKNGYDFFIFGDSHAFSVFPQFDRAAKELGLSGKTISQSGCLPFFNIEPDRGENGKHCVDLNNKVFEFVKNNQIKKIFLIARWNYYTLGLHGGTGFQNIRMVGSDFPAALVDREKIFLHGLQNTIREYLKIGVDLHIVSQAPYHLMDPKKAYNNIHNRPFYARNKKPIRIVTYGLQRHIHDDYNRSPNAVLANAVGEKNLHDFTDVLCNINICPIGSEEEAYYWDSNHLSIAGSLLLKNKTIKILRSLK